MTVNKMYSQRAKQGNIAFHRGCGEDKNGCNKKWCDYCAFERLIQMNKNCLDCRVYKPHTHPEVLDKKPPKTEIGEFVTFSLAGEVSFMKDSDWLLAWDYMRKYPETTFLIQSKDPACFLKWRDVISNNIIIGTTIETNRNLIGYGIPVKCDSTWYKDISRAPFPIYRYEAMLKLTCRKAVTIEPAFCFDLEVMVKWIKEIMPAFCYIGYCNDGKQGKRLKLPEPPLEKTLELIDALELSGIDVRRKTLRPAWWE